MIKIHDPECTGCTACYAVCPTKSIKMTPDEEGFLFPEIDSDTCIHCDKCENVCSSSSQSKHEYSDYCYMATSADGESLFQSSSGGMFPLLAKDMLSKKGYVCGCILDKGCVARHVVSQDPQVILAMSKSKYVQSDMGECFRQIQGLLNRNHAVLFSGTPCQVGGLRSFLSREYEKLVTMDFACHGVPSPLIFHHYANTVKAYNPEVHSFWFRNKSEGWNKSVCMTWIDTQGKPLRKIPALQDDYWKDFAEFNNLRKSCSVCKFCTPQRCADFTVGDHWAIGKSPYYNPLGISFILCNTEYALKWLREHEDEFQLLERITLKSVNQPHFWRPYACGKKRQQVFDKIKRGEYNE